MANELIAHAITDYYGERCPEYDADCFCCKAWAEFDRLRHAARPAPAATDTGLETVAWNCTYPTYGHFTLKEQEAKQAIEDGATVEEFVTRSQAEAIVAEERAQTDAYGIALMMIREGCENPYLVARNALERFSKWR